MPHVSSDAGAKRVYLIGICGTAMASLAGMLQKRGLVVTGSDEHVYPPMSTYLADLGIPIFEGYTNEHLETFRPDLVIIGNAIHRSNPEAVATLESDLPYMSMPEAIYELFIREKHSIVVTGTHGKTTTTSLMAWLLEAAEQDPSYMVGGIPVNFGHNFKLGDGEHFVIEGDEYNTAFFDKGPKFLHYHADSLILNNIEFDHADIYDDLDAIMEAFRAAAAALGDGDRAIANGDDPNVGRLLDSVAGEWITFGLGKHCDVRAREISFTPEGSRFTVDWRGEKWSEFTTPLAGRHNVANALACLTTARLLGLGAEELRKGLETFRGIRRRMEIRGVERQVTVIDDFAHHPTAIETTLEGARNVFPGRRIWALFEPRSISSARKEFEKDYARAFRKADRVIIGPVFHLERFRTRYGLDKMMDVDDVAGTLTASGTPARHITDFEEIAETVANEAQEGDVVIAMSSGAFGGIHELLLEKLRSTS
ncbi:MAG: UDP-N-acetylmuramate:L-alanyl-gamma-D-glutamyl-meso-diaminopimelate ligase [Thermoanaerobaculia bacterium]|nr:UDP-N-acetylmuramate:L-alanyl-gamma-D-glutamyl-meso-diaminopimelate ligase [Thermoanaerobaculia bacterium]